jgi:iron transport multicopper oxidase
LSDITALIQYSPSAPVSEPTVYQEYPEFEELDLVPVVAETFAPADVSFDLNVNFDTYSDGTNRASCKSLACPVVAC